MRCPSCNARIPDDSRFCPECGKKFKKKYRNQYERRQASANGLVILIAVLCALLLIGFVLIAVKLILLDKTPGPSVDEITILDPEADSGTGSDDELSGESLVMSEEEDALADDEQLIENPARDMAMTADYDLTVQADVTITGHMSQQGSEKVLLLSAPASFYGKDATGTKVLVNQIETIHFASSRSKISIQELRSVPNGSVLTCSGGLYIHDGEIFIRLEDLSWESGEDAREYTAVG